MQSLVLGFDPSIVANQESIKEVEVENLKRAIHQKVYKSQIEKLRGHQLDGECCLVYGVAAVGKSHMFDASNEPFADVVDCTQMGTLIKQADQIDVALEYLELRF